MNDIVDYKQIEWSRYMIAAAFIATLFLSSCCIEIPQIPPIFGEKTTTTHVTTTTEISATTTTIIQSTDTSTTSLRPLPTTTTTIYDTTYHPTLVSLALTTYDYHAYENPEVKIHAEYITEGCEDDECRLFRIHEYAIDNFYYRKNETQEDTEWRPDTVGELLTKRYGMCTHFAAYYYNYLKSLGIEAHVVLVPEHTYTLSCNPNITRLQRYIENDSDFKEYVKDHIFPSFEFDMNGAFDKTCIHLEGPSATKGAYRYPGEYYEETKFVENQNYFINPETGDWEFFNKTDVKIEEPRALLQRNYFFEMGENSRITWKMVKTKKRIDGGLDYDFAAKDVKMSTRYGYATFTMPELTRFDRVRVNITIKSTNPLLFYTLQEINQLDNFIYFIENRYASIKDCEEKTDWWRIDEIPRTGSHSYEFDYIRSCSHAESVTYLSKECLIPDAGRRIYVIHNEGLFKTNQVNISIKYLEFL